MEEVGPFEQDDVALYRQPGKTRCDVRPTLLYSLDDLFRDVLPDL
jgi:hypothetical protein